MPTIMPPFQLRTREDSSFFLCVPLLSVGLLVATSTRHEQEHAASRGAFQGTRAASFARFLRALGVSERPLITLRQRHTHECLILDSDARDVSRWRDEPPVGDAVATRCGEIVLGIHTADCAPIFLVDMRTRARAAIHAGWRGTLGRIVERTFQKMAAHFGTRPEDCHAAIGPAIGPCCYEVGPEVLDLFRREFPYAEQIILSPKASGHAHLDIVEANIRQLLACSIPGAQIYASRLCTACHPELFFSHRRDSRQGRRIGRMLSVITDLPKELSL